MYKIVLPIVACFYLFYSILKCLDFVMLGSTSITVFFINVSVNAKLDHSLFTFI